jgi:hypothetical protein
MSLPVSCGGCWHGYIHQKTNCTTYIHDVDPGFHHRSRVHDDGVHNHEGLRVAAGVQHQACPISISHSTCGNAVPPSFCAMDLLRCFTSNRLRASLRHMSRISPSDRPCCRSRGYVHDSRRRLLWSLFLLGYYGGWIYLTEKYTRVQKLPKLTGTESKFTQEQVCLNRYAFR